MADLKLTRKAMGLFYSALAVFLADARLAARVSFIRKLPGCTLLLIDADGRIHARGEEAGCATIPLYAVPSGLAGIIISGDTEGPARQILRLYKDTTSAHVPACYKAGFLPLRSRVAVFVAECLAVWTERQSARLGHLEKQNVQLRLHSERSASRLEAARRMLEGAGYAAEYPVCETGQGGGQIGPGAAIDTTSFSQILPVDAAGLTRVDLYVSSPAGGDIVSGSLRVRVLRAADETCLGNREIDFADIETGWFSVPVTFPDTLIYGDAKLELTWQLPAGISVAPGIPLVGLSDATAKRFGAGGLTATLRIWCGLPDPSQIETGINKQSIWPVRFADVMASAIIPGGRAALAERTARLSLAPVMFVEELGYLQLHPTHETPTATAFAGLLNSDAAEIRARISNAHEAAPTYRYVMACLPAGCAVATDYVEALARDIDAASANGETGKTVDGGIWARLDLNGGTEGVLALSLDTIPVDDRSRHDILLMVLPQDGHTNYGWCRWYSLDIISSPGGQK